MRRLLLTILSLFLAAPVLAAPSADVAAVRALPDRFADAWAKHDGHALAALAADDIDFVNVGATWLHGKHDFELYHTRLLDDRFREALIVPIERDVRFVRRDLAVVHWTWRMTGDRDPDGKVRPPRTGLMTMVVEKRAGRWLMIVAQNTNAGPGGAPEMAGLSSPLRLPRSGDPAERR